MTTTTDERDLVRQEYFECDGPVEVDIELAIGSIEVRFADDAGSPSGSPADSDAGSGAEPEQPDVLDGELADISDEGSAEDMAADRSADAPAEHVTPDEMPADAAAVDDAAEAVTSEETVTNAVGGQAIMVEVRHAPRAGGWGLAGLLDWVGREFGAPTGDIAAEAVRQTSISAHGNRLTVRGPRTMPLRTVSLAIVVHAPAGSSLRAKAGSANVRVGGLAGRVDAATGSGDVSVDRATGSVQVKTGSGAVRLGPVPDGLNARTGSGDVEVTALDGGGSLVSGSGDIWLGTVRGAEDDTVTIKTGSGDLTVAEAVAGRLQLVTGSGDLRVGIRSGVLAEVDVVSGSGRARCDLPMSGEPPSGRAPTALRVRARTGSGDAVVTTATA